MTDHDYQYCNDRDCKDETCVGYRRYCDDMQLEQAPPLPMPVNRLDPTNRCDQCGEPPTAENPCTWWPGEPADLENGPSERDLPYMLHDYDCSVEA